MPKLTRLVFNAAGEVGMIIRTDGDADEDINFRFDTDPAYHISGGFHVKIEEDTYNSLSRGTTLDTHALKKAVISRIQAGDIRDSRPVLGEPVVKSHMDAGQVVDTIIRSIIEEDDRRQLRVEKELNFLHVDF